VKQRARTCARNRGKASFSLTAPALRLPSRFSASYPSTQELLALLHVSLISIHATKARFGIACAPLHSHSYFCSLTEQFTVNLCRRTSTTKASSIIHVSVPLSGSRGISRKDSVRFRHRLLVLLLRCCPNGPAPRYYVPTSSLSLLLR
jgi:hypothetical protein